MKKVELDGVIFEATQDNEGDFCPMLDIDDNRLEEYRSYNEEEMIEYGLEGLIGKKNVYPFTGLELVD